MTNGYQLRKLPDLTWEGRQLRRINSPQTRVAVVGVQVLITRELEMVARQEGGGLGLGNRPAHNRGIMMRGHRRPGDDRRRRYSLL